MAGFAASSHNHFCAICRCTRKEHGYSNINCNTWQWRKNAESCTHAEAFKGAESEEGSEAVFAASGLRWSELLRLPYFDSSHFVVINAMHNLFLGRIQGHFQGILGIRLVKDSNSDFGPVINITLADNNLKDAERKSLSKALNWLTSPMNQDLASNAGMEKWMKKLSNVHLEALNFLCQELQSVLCSPLSDLIRTAQNPTNSAQI